MDRRGSGRLRGVRLFLRIALWMVLMAIGVAWLAALAFPLAIKLGLTESAASKLPNAGLLAGAALGLTMCLVKSVKQGLVSLSLILITASVFWFFGLVLEGILVNLSDIPEGKLGWLQPVGFGFGFILAGIGVSAEIYERFSVSSPFAKRSSRRGRESGE